MVDLVDEGLHSCEWWAGNSFLSYSLYDKVMILKEQNVKDLLLKKLLKNYSLLILATINKIIDDVFA